MHANQKLINTADETHELLYKVTTAAAVVSVNVSSKA